MSKVIDPVNLNDMDAIYEREKNNQALKYSYAASLSKYLAEGDTRLNSLRFDASVASLRLWSFLLSEEDRLRTARAEGQVLIGTMKDLGTVPVIVNAAKNMTAFYPDGAWWIPCVMELSACLLDKATSLGIGEQFCPVRAMLAALETGEHFPVPDLLISSGGAICDDFSAIAARLESLSHEVFWFEMPSWRKPEINEPSTPIPLAGATPDVLLEITTKGLKRVRNELNKFSQNTIDDAALAESIKQANVIRQLITEIKKLATAKSGATLPALELLIVEMIGIHFCSDIIEAEHVLKEILSELKNREANNITTSAPDALRVYWVNPVADLRAMNLLEDVGGRLVGTDFMISHSEAQIPTSIPPLQALAQMAMADPMIAPSHERARRIAHQAKALSAQAVVVSRIAGASHCATEGEVIKNLITRECEIPVIEIEVPPVADAMLESLRTRLQALVETA